MTGDFRTKENIGSEENGDRFLITENHVNLSAGFTIRYDLSISRTYDSLNNISDLPYLVRPLTRQLD
jgi:hypothetical protein